MNQEMTVFDVLKIVLLWLSPIIFVEGWFLTLFKADKQMKLEEFFNQKIGLTKRVVPSIERNIYSLHNWLMKRTFILGIFFIIYSVLLVVVLLHL